MSESTAVSTVVNPPAFAKQGPKMGDLFVKHLQEILHHSMTNASVNSFSSEECPYTHAVNEKVVIKLADGRTVCCSVTTPRGET